MIALILAIWLGPEQTSDGKTMHQIPMWVGLGFIIVYAGYVVLLVMQARRPTASPKGEESKDEQKSAEKEPSSENRFSPIKAAVSTVLGMAGIGVAVHFLVHSGLELFHTIGFSEAIAGVTLLAAATSLPDTLLSVFAARRGDADGAVSNAVGSNSFDILICLGAPIFIMGGIAVDWSSSWPLLIFLLASTLTSVTFLFTDWSLSRREAAVMGGIYVLFMVLAFTGIL